MTELNAKSETDASNTDISGANIAENCPMSGLNDAIRGLTGMAKRAYDRDHAGAWVTVGGTANAITLTYSVGPAAYVTGEKFAFAATASNTGATTVNVSGLGAKNIKTISSAGTVALAGNEIVNGKIVELEYDGTQFLLLNPSPDDGTWTPAIAGSSTPGTQVYANRQGSYTRTGNIITAYFYVTLSVIDNTTAGNITITGLPYTDANQVGIVAGAIGYYSGVTFSAGYAQLGIALTGGTRVITIYQSGGSAASALALPTSGAGNTLALNGVISYRVN